MENKRITSIMFMKFNNRDSHGSLLKKDKESIVVVNKPFAKKVIDTEVDIDTNVKDNKGTNSVADALFIWGSIFKK